MRCGVGLSGMSIDALARRWISVVVRVSAPRLPVYVPTLTMIPCAFRATADVNRTLETWKSPVTPKSAGRNARYQVSSAVVWPPRVAQSAPSPAVTTSDVVSDIVTEGAEGEDPSPVVGGGTPASGMGGGASPGSESSSADEERERVWNIHAPSAMEIVATSRADWHMDRYMRWLLWWWASSGFGVVSEMERLASNLYFARDVSRFRRSLRSGFANRRSRTFAG